MNCCMGTKTVAKASCSRTKSPVLLCNTLILACKAGSYSIATCVMLFSKVFVGEFFVYEKKSLEFAIQLLFMVSGCSYGAEFSTQ